MSSCAKEAISLKNKEMEFQIELLRVQTQHESLNTIFATMLASVVTWLVADVTVALSSAPEGIKASYESNIIWMLFLIVVIFIFLTANLMYFTPKELYRLRQNFIDYEETEKKA